MKLTLGTVQFGLPYGIANKGGQVSIDEAGKILNLARKSGIDMLDTAIVYGDSEECLGAFGTQSFRVVTKLPALPDGIYDIAAWVDEQVKTSLQRLKVDSFYGLLLHHSGNLQGASGRPIVQALEHLKAEGIVQKIGVSIYAPRELDAVTKVFAIDLVQAPLNLVDRRLVTSGWLRRLHNMGVEVHARSIFLQGLLLLPRKEIPTQFERWAKIWDAWHDELSHYNQSAIAACLHYALSIPLVDRVVVGVDSVAQLRELIAIAQFPGTPKDWLALVCEDENLINPAKWDLL